MAENKPKVIIDGVEYPVALPVKWNSLLDERLDEVRLSLRYIDREIFMPGTLVSITFNYGENSALTETVTFIVSADESTEVPPGSGEYNHELALIEYTKITEGIVCETMSFTNNLGRTYASNPVKVEPVYE